MANFDLILESTVPARHSLAVWGDEPSEVRASRLTTRGGVPHLYHQIKLLPGESVLVTIAAKIGAVVAPDDATIGAANGLFELGWFAEAPATSPPVVAVSIVGTSARQNFVVSSGNVGHHLFVMRRLPPTGEPLKAGGLVGLPFVVRL